MGSEGEIVRKPRFLCLHGFRTSGDILMKQLGKWPESVLQKIDLVFADGPFPSQGKSDVEGIFDPPYYEWFQFNKVSFYLFLVSLISFLDKQSNYLSPEEALLSNRNLQSTRTSTSVLRSSRIS